MTDPTRTSVDDWKMTRGKWRRSDINFIDVLRPGFGRVVTVDERGPSDAESLCYAICDSILREREAYSPAPDAPAPSPLETIASDVEAIVRQHLMLVDNYAMLHRASLDSSSQYAQRQCMQAREAVADSVRRIRGLR